MLQIVKKRALVDVGPFPPTTSLLGERASSPKQELIVGTNIPHKKENVNSENEKNSNNFAKRTQALDQLPKINRSEYTPKEKMLAELMDELVLM